MIGMSSGVHAHETDIIDPCVYKSNGWLLYGSRKANQINGGYVLQGVANGDGIEDEHDLSYLDLLQLQSIFHFDVDDVSTLQWQEGKKPVLLSTKRKRQPEGSAKQATVRTPITFTTDEVQQLYEAAGGTLPLTKKVDERGPYWLEVAPHTDGRPCLAAAHAGEMHSHNAIIRPNAHGLVYICLKDPSATCLLTTEYQIELKLAMSGDIGLAKLLHRHRGHDLVNVGTKSADWRRFDPDSGLWQQKETDDIKTHELPQLAEVIKGLISQVPDDDSAKAVVKRLSSVLHNLQNQKLRNAVVQDCTSLFRNVDLKKQFDMKLEHFSVENGLIDLRTGEIAPRQREDYITFHNGLVYDPDNTDTSQ